MSPPPPNCVPVEVSYTCGGNPAAGPVALQSSYSPMPTVGGGSFFANSNCSGSPVTSVAAPANISFRPAVVFGRPLVGAWQLTGTIDGGTTPALVLLQGEVRASATRLQVGACTAFATPTLTWPGSTVPVGYWQDLTLEFLALPSMFAFCGDSTVTIPAVGPPTVPSLRANRLFPGTMQLIGTEMGTSGTDLQRQLRLHDLHGRWRGGVFEQRLLWVIDHALRRWARLPLNAHPSSHWPAAAPARTSTAGGHFHTSSHAKPASTKAS